MLAACPHRLVVRRTVLVDEGGDHVCVVSEPVRAESSGRFTPLRLSDVADLEPGHEVEERPRPATERATQLTSGRQSTVTASSPLPAPLAAGAVSAGSAVSAVAITARRAAT